MQPSSKRAIRKPYPGRGRAEARQGFVPVRRSPWLALLPGDRFADFLRHYRADTIYLVGDIVDGWRLSAHWYWPSTHSDVLLQLLSAARQGSKVVYVPGQSRRVPARLLRRAFRRALRSASPPIHRGADGRRYLVIHGDHFDKMMDRAQGFRGARPSRQSRRARGQCRAQSRAPFDGAALLADDAMGQTQVQEGHQLYRRLRKSARRMSRKSTASRA